MLLYKLKRCGFKVKCYTAGMKKLDIKKIMSWLGLVLRCPICGIKYNLDNTQVLESQQSPDSPDTRLLIHSDCQKCKSSVMFNIDINGADIFSVGMVTDLTSNDSAKFSRLEPIDVNECIALHKSLKNFRGDFIKVFGKHKV